MTAVLTVWWGDQTVGALRIDRQGDIEFTYDEAWRAAPNPIFAAKPVLFLKACCRRRASVSPSHAPSASRNRTNSVCLSRSVERLPAPYRFGPKVKHRQPP